LDEHWHVEKRTVVPWPAGDEDVLALGWRVDFVDCPNEERISL